jgi:hypothetical protein
MLFTIIYKLSKKYTQEENRDGQGKEEVIPHYFYQKPLILIVAGTIIYFLLMNVESFKVAIPFYSLIVPIDLYLLNRDIEQDKEMYRTKRLISLDEYDINRIVENSDDRSHSNKLYYLASLIYEYVTNKGQNIKYEKQNNINKSVQSKLQTEFENNYEPETMNLCKTMEHTLDNIMNKEQL